MPGETYLSAGVDLQLMDDVIHRAKAFARTTHGPVVEGISEGFAGLYRLEGFKAPIMVASTDGVGTKLKIASLLGHWEGLGIDLVNLNVNDVLTWGARPLFFLDYISLSSLDAQVVETLLRGMAWACRQVGCALIGGETAQMPGLYREGDLDLAGFLVGAVEENELLGRSRVQEGDVLLGLPSSGLHTNGLSLVRRVFEVDSNPAVLYQHFDELSHTLGEELLIPHRCYYPLLAPVLPLINGMVHVTGGGLPGKMPVNLPLGMAARFRLDAWDVPPIFQVIQRRGGIETEEMFRVFNMGLGMVLMCAPERTDAVVAALPEVRVIGEVVRHTEGERVIIGP